MALEAVQAQAGHASIESTRIYLHLADDWLAAQYRKAAEVIDAQVFADHPMPTVAGSAAGDCGERAAAAAHLGRAAARRPQIVATMRRYLEQIGCVLRPGSVNGADLALRSFAAFLVETAPEVTSDRAGDPPSRRGLQALAGQTARAEQDQAHHRDPGAPARARCGCSSSGSMSGAGTRHRPGCRCSPATCPARTTRCPRRSTTPPPRSCCAPPRPTSGCWSGSPSRCCCAPGCGSASSPTCAADAVVQIGAGPWLHVPVGKLREDRYLPLHPQLVDADRRLPHRPRPAPDHPLLLPRENGRATGPAHRHPVPQQGRRRSRTAAHPPPPAAAHPGHPGHQPRHAPGGDRRDARPPQHGHDPALRQDRQPHRRRRVLRRHRPGRRPLRPGRAAARRRHRTQDGPAAPRAPPTPRQRLLHPTTRAGLRLRVDLRDLHASSRPASSSDPPCKPNTTTPQPRTRPGRQSSSPPCSPPSDGTHHDPTTAPPHPARRAARTPRRRRQRDRPRRSHRDPRPTPHPLLARRHRRPTPRPGQPAPPKPTGSCPTPSPRPATRG